MVAGKTEVAELRDWKGKLWMDGNAFNTEEKRQEYTGK